MLRKILVAMIIVSKLVGFTSSTIESIQEDIHAEWFFEEEDHSEWFFSE